MRRLRWIVFVLATAACAGDTGVSDRPTGSLPRAGGPFASSGMSTGTAGISAIPPVGGGVSTLAGAPGLLFDSGTPADPSAGCVATSVTAPPVDAPAVDIVWIVDASGSMVDEQMKIGMNLTAFADRISRSNIDVRIVMLTTSSAIPIICPVTNPDPLAGTALAGDPRYKFIDTAVDSSNALSIATINFAMYRDFLRPNAITHFVTVSDDESVYQGLTTPVERATSFREDMQKLLGHDFIQHTISSEGPTPCGSANCMPDPNTGLCVFVMLGCGATRPGDTYYALADMTQGLKASICSSDWSPVFDRLSDAVIKSAPLPCNYVIPPPPAGQNLDPQKVNVGYRRRAGMSEMLFPKANHKSECGMELGWYYDDPGAPKQILLCPAACEGVSGGGTLRIAFGCETIVLL